MNEDESSQLFQQAMKSTGTLPLRQKKHKKIPIMKPGDRLSKHTFEKRRAAAQHKNDDYQLLLQNEQVTPVEPEQKLAYKHSSISKKQMIRLQNLEIPVEDIMDLHGKTIDQAHQAIHIFLEHCLQQNKRCICIIHGKAHSAHDRTNTLKSHIDSWLRIPNILAFCSAPSHYGGTGAVLVLLKRHRDIH